MVVKIFKYYAKSWQSWRDTFGQNSKTPFRGLQQCAPELLKGKANVYLWKTTIKEARRRTRHHQDLVSQSSLDRQNQSGEKRRTWLGFNITKIWPHKRVLVVPEVWTPHPKTSPRSGRARLVYGVRFTDHIVDAKTKKQRSNKIRIQYRPTRAVRSSLP